MRLAIATNTLNSNTPAALERASQLGFDTVEINLQAEEFGYDYRRKPGARFYRSLRQQLDDLGLRVWSVTPPALAQHQMFFERARKDILIGSAITAGILGGRVFVLQPADVFVSEMTFHQYMSDGSAPPVIEGFDEAWVQAANRRVSTTIVNVDYWLGIPLTNQTDRISRITRDLAIGWALDVRNALHRNTLDAWLEAGGDKLGVAYLDDRDEQGARQLPMRADWQQILVRLAKTKLKTCVIRGNQASTDTEIISARRAVEQILQAS